jgi:hypothetical protein
LDWAYLVQNHRLPRDKLGGGLTCIHPETCSSPQSREWRCPTSRQHTHRESLRHARGPFPFLRRRRGGIIRRCAGARQYSSTRRLAMDGKRGTVHERWVQRAEAAYRRMFEGKSTGRTGDANAARDYGGGSRQGAGRVSPGRTGGTGSGGGADRGVVDMLSEMWPPRNARGGRKPGLAGADADDACRRDCLAASALGVCAVPALFFRSTFG